MSSVNLTGSRATLIANIIASIVAFMIAVEVTYIEDVQFGHVLPNDTFLCFFPAIVMFLVRSEPLSYLFLLIYSIISIDLLFVARDLFIGISRFSKGNDPLLVLVLFAMVTGACLIAYFLISLMRLAISSSNK
ncbi:membrane hypothetical protein [Bradyrhizobium sp. STM 3843]|uniref:hypothetical protein n=1 Tax=Bradyrhizobium sp. STM 3843 TaxID=551947 RepID=UPI0002403650|nr:hypothetical protein [Bradyrhizobium sp. STM 3843]CCE07757.1 membrane hypothetical protein [Bradyrhizobium sp. STM 3843]